MDPTHHGEAPSVEASRAGVMAEDSTPAPGAGSELCVAPRDGAWHVTLPVFEGPLDLFLYLVRCQKIALADIPLAKLAEQYLAYVELMQWLQLDLAAEFLVMAATLVWWKSRELLPDPVVADTEETEAAPDDLRQQLIRQLAEYDALRRCAAWLQQALATNNLIRRQVPLPPLEPPPVAPPSTVDLALTFAMLVRRQRAHMPRVLNLSELRIEDHFQPLRAVARRGGVFQEYLQELRELAAWVAAFLALLFLFQNGEIQVHQPQPFGPIYLRPGAQPPANTLSGK